MNLPKTIRQIYREETGKDAEIASPLEGFELAVYVEAPSKDYIDWLERRASRTGGSANTSTNIASDAMRRFDDVDIESLSDHDLAWTARIIVREYRAALTHIA